MAVLSKTFCRCAEGCSIITESELNSDKAAAGLFSKCG